MNCSVQPIIKLKNPRFILSSDVDMIQYVHFLYFILLMLERWCIKFNQVYSMEGNMGETTTDYLKILMSCQANSKMESKEERH